MPQGAEKSGPALLRLLLRFSIIACVSLSRWFRSRLAVIIKNIIKGQWEKNSVNCNKKVMMKISITVVSRNKSPF